MEELADASSLRRDPQALCRRLAADGYLFLRGLLPAAAVRAAAGSVLAELYRGGWVTPDGIPSADRRALDFREALGHPAFRAALTSPAFNRVPYLTELRRLIRAILGPQAFSYPVKVLRAVYPERPPGMARGRYIHQDYAATGVQDMLTTWVPLTQIPVRLGGLAVRPGSHLGPPRQPRVLGDHERGWATIDYQPGDVLVFHCLTSHAALPNRGTALRLSGDFRWQRADQRAPAELVLGPVAAGHELFSRLLGHEPWWEPVPRATSLSPREQLAAQPPGPSRYFAVHPGWQRWKPPAGAVHWN
ncbi:MAG: phytanoyl-CoA dioxygenase family protein [Streptosporangiaceae bacterium]